MDFSDAIQFCDGTTAGVGVKATGDHQCLDCQQKFDIEQAKKLHYKIERINFPQFGKRNDLRMLTGIGKTVPDQPIHDRARSKPEVIDEAGTSGAEAQTISPLPQHAQVWLRVSTKNSRISKEQELYRGKEKKKVQNSFRERAGRKETSSRRRRMGTPMSSLSSLPT